MSFQLNKTERILLILSLIVFILAGTHLGWLYYMDHSTSIPAEGGTYTEGVVGSITFINPLFAKPNTLNADIVSLVYSGLTKYNPTTQKIEPDLATYTLDNSKKKYFFTLRDNAKWHDGQPVTIEDILFTYKDIVQNPEFQDPILRASLKDIVIEKVNEKTVSFTLKEPYYFFPAATTLGILPKHVWKDIPVSDLDKSELNLAPIGSGPYKVKKIKSADTDNVTTIDLQVFDGYYGNKPKISGITFVAYPDMSSLLSHLSSVDAINNIPYHDLSVIRSDPRFQIFPYTLPQYVGVFFNTASKKLEDKRTRLALLLGTNKDSMIQDVPGSKRLDTPFFEVKNSSWIYQFDTEKAKGSLFDAGWKLPSSINTNSTSFIPSAYVASLHQITSTYGITEPNGGKDFTTKETYFVIRGTNPTSATGIVVNGYALKKFTPEKGTWSYIASVDLGTLKPGKNVYTVYYLNEKGNKVFLDSITITYDNQYKTPLLPSPSFNTNSTPADTTINTNTNNNINNNLNANPVIMNENTNSARNNINRNTNSIFSSSGIPPHLANTIRYNSNNEPLIIQLITTETPQEFPVLAKKLQEQWLQIGVYLNIEILSVTEMLKRIQEKSYDIVLYGQSLGYNLDVFPYWHSSQTGMGGLNLSNFKSFQADALIEEIRNPYLNKNIDMNNIEQIEKFRQDNLQKLISLFEDNIPAIFLYQPTYFYAVDTKKIHNVDVHHLSYFSDRFASVSNWFKQESRVLTTPFSWDSFQTWILHNM
jgi:ABC-type transport system substrate-binding protein